MKTGLVVEGGGMRGIYGAGVLDAFLDAGLVFEYACGTSAGAANVLSFAAGQKGRNHRYYTEHMLDPQCMGMGNMLHGKGFFNFDYLYGELSTRIDPLDFNALRESPYEAEFVAAEAYTCRARYFTKDDVSADDCSALKASCCVPGYCKPVRVGSALYFDGGVVDSIPVARAITKGCDLVVVVLARARGYVKPPQNHKLIYRYSLRKYPRISTAVDNRHENYNRSITFIDALETQGAALVVAPSRDIPVGLTTSNLALLEEFYQVGLADGRAAAAQLLAEHAAIDALVA
ncbi:MAG: patatin family protein [Oscillospiraceae bacterium]|jgi:predicted patatin/cPLA2 family phospholipase|nr:patatin family protein [Oscillospiraceae bacterium]